MANVVSICEQQTVLRRLSAAVLSIFFWSSFGLTQPLTVRDLGTLPGFSTSVANDINESGQVVGTAGKLNNPASYHAFVYSSGVITDLGTLGGSLSSASGINNNGQVVGSSSLVGTSPRHA